MKLFKTDVGGMSFINDDNILLARYNEDLNRVYLSPKISDKEKEEFFNQLSKAIKIKVVDVYGKGGFIETKTLHESKKKVNKNSKNSEKEMINKEEQNE